MKHPFKYRQFFLCICLFLASSLTVAASVTTPVPAEKNASQSDPDEIRAELKSAQAELAIVETEAPSSSAIPAPHTDEEQQQKHHLLQEIVRAYEQILANQDRLAEAQKQTDAAQKEWEAWVEFKTPPPYSVLFLDKLIKDLNAVERNLKAVTSEYKSNVSFHDHLIRSIQSDAAEIRRIEESQQSGATQTTSSDNLDSEKTSPAQSLDLMRLRARLKTIILKELESSNEILRLETARATTEVKLAERKGVTARANVVFPEEDFQTIHTELDTESQNASNSFAKLLEAEQARKKRKAEIENTIRDAGTPVVDSVGLFGTLRLLPTIIEIKRGLWDLRYRLYHSHSPSQLTATVEQKNKYASTLSLFSTNVKRQLQNSEEVVSRLESLLLSAESAEQRQVLRIELESSVKRREQLRNMEADVQSAQFIIARLEDELSINKASLGISGWTKTMTSGASDIVEKIWNFELFTAENTIEVDGRKITGTSSITIAKLMRAITLFAIGVFIALWLGRVAEKHLVHRFGFEAAHARILRKWLLTLGLLILVFVVLLWANIPLSIFAFLGGAVAIGVGFGMQNIFKNLISGLMLLFERPFKPGDTVQVSGIKGSITEIGIRSSVIRDENGVDTLIPNSVFVEENVMNWVYDNSRVRSSIGIGVAYGSPVREVMAILEDCVRRHGLVLTDPKPAVFFDDFGADALQFVIFYWLEIGPKISGRQVASDLRFMIEKSMNDKGIVIAYPQRDVHLDASNPLKIELTRRESK